MEGRLARLTLVSSLIPSVLLILALRRLGVSGYLIGILAVLLAFLILYCVGQVWQKAQFHFRSLHNLIGAVVLGDYTYRGFAPGDSGAYGDTVDLINSLGETLQQQRLQAEESSLLLRKVVEQFDVAIVAWDEEKRIQWINPAAEALLGRPAKAEHSSSTSSSHDHLPQELAFTSEMKVKETRVVGLVFGGHQGRYRLHMERFVAQGNPHSLLFITNVSNILRLEEKRAWQNLIRVLSHEINNSLSPLSSLSNALKRQVHKREKDPQLEKELTDGLSVIGDRAKSLTGFVKNYQSIAKLPDPKKAAIELKQLFTGLIRLFPEEDIRLEGEAIMLIADSSQIEQVLINLIKNSVEANMAYADLHGDEKGPIIVSWSADPANLSIEVVDSGGGIQNPENLFTPFYSTKAHGSGVGLVFCQRIIEAHGGYLSIENRTDHHGCFVKIELPLKGDARGPDPQIRLGEDSRR
jgi:two-component system nitrogen regulation sensor histidine kinase NtrY